MMVYLYKFFIFLFIPFFVASPIYATENSIPGLPIKGIREIPSKKEIDNIVKATEKNTTVTRLEGEINNRLSHIDVLDKEIEKLELDLLSKQQEAQSVRDEAYILNVSKNKTEKQSKEIENNIRENNKKLRYISERIIKTQREIYLIRYSIKNLYQNINELEHSEPILSIFSKKGILRLLKNIEEVKNVKVSLINKITEIKRLEEEFRDIESTTKIEKNNLSTLQIDINSKKRVLAIAVKEKEKLLDLTQGDEQNYLKLLKENQNARVKLQEEIFDFEARLKFSLDPTKIPEKGTKLLSKPFSGSYILTQKFGNTNFARRSGRYANSFHDGIDWGTPRGTRIISTADGVVSGLGNTDLSSNCPWYGKWITVDHKNGLTSLYAHLDIQRVFPGQKVERGSLLGYSGNTGNSTGPHLHFSIYATAGFKIVPYSQLSTKRRCIGILLPIAAKDAKLDPLDYLSI